MTYAAPADTTPPTVMLTEPVTTTELTFEITAVFSGTDNRLYGG
ncbi:MAG: hypothetical protein ACNYPI_01315 [Arenicellales bacterium WSBS_2016_MAG_OTU3]